MQDLNTDKQAFFQKTFYGNINPDCPILTEQGCPSRSNPEGLQTFLQKPQKKSEFLSKNSTSSDSDN
jgi:hypothetical protein